VGFAEYEKDAQTRASFICNNFMAGTVDMFQNFEDDFQETDMEQLVLSPN